MRDRLAVLAGALAGVAVAVALSALQEPAYVADASVLLVRQGQPPRSDPALASAAEAAAELFHSRAVADSAVANLRLDDSAEELLDRTDTSVEPASSLVRLRVEARSGEEARRTAQELAEVATVLYNDRFGPATTAAIWETPQVEEQAPSPDRALLAALGALAGALLAQLALGLGRGLSARPARPRRVSARDTVLQAPPAPAPAPAPEPEPEPEPEPVAVEPEPVAVEPPAAVEPPVAEPERPAAARFVEPRLGEWTVRDVELLLAEQGDAFPERLDELHVYLATFRDVADPDGRLPGGVAAVLEDVFRDLVERARLESAP